MTSGFVIDQIELKGFMRYVDAARIPFANQFTVVTGPTGSGKTTLLDAITFALYGRSSRTDVKVKIDEFVDKNGYVKLSFDQSGQKYNVTRGRNNGRNFLTLERGSQKIAGSVADLEYKIENLVSLDYTGFVNSTFIRQDEMKQIGSESGSQRLEIFERLFRLETFEQAQDLADKKLRTAEIQLASAKAEMSQKQIEFEETLPKERERLQEVLRNHSVLQKGAEDLEMKTNLLKQSVERLEGVHKKYEAAAREVSETAREIETSKSEMDTAELKNQERLTIKKRLEGLASAAKEEKKLLQVKSSLESRAEKARSIQDQIKLHNSAIERAQRSLAQEIKEIGDEQRKQKERLRLVATAMDKDEAFGLLRLEGRLTERIERITKERVWLKDFLTSSFIETLATEQKEAQVEITKVAARVKKIGGSTFVKAEIETSLTQIEERLEKAKKRTDAQIGHERQEVRKLEQQSKKIHFDRADSDRLRQVTEELKKVSKAAREYESTQSKLEKLESYDTLIANLKKRIQTLGAKLQSHSDVEKNLRKDEEAYGRARLDYETCRVELGKLGKRVGEAIGEKNALERRVKDLESLGPEIEQLKEGLKDHERQREVFAILKQEIFHRKGILVFAINQLLQGISIEASQILGDLTDQRLNNIRMLPTKEVRGGAVRIDVEGVDGLFHDVSTFSGGEKTQINASLRFAIAKELARMPQIGRAYGNMKTLFIDEGDLGSLDTENARVYFVKKLLNLGDLFERIILITHITEVADQFPNRIRISMTPEKVSKVELGEIPA